MSTLQTLKNQIASDLHRTDLTTQISTAITSAIRHYEREPFWFLEGRAELTISSGSAWYGVPSDLKSYSSLLVKISGSQTPLTRVHYSTMDEEDSGIISGIPSEWAYYQDNLRFYPPPDGEYVITLSYNRQIANDMSASSSISWTNEGFDLIRYRSEWEVYANVLRQPDMAATAKTSEIDEYQSLIGENTARIATGKIKKGEW